MINALGLAVGAVLLSPVIRAGVHAADRTINYYMAKERRGKLIQ